MTLLFNAGRAGLRLTSARVTRAFDRALLDPKDAQDALLSQILSGMSRSEYGHRLRLHGNESYEQFVRSVPMQSYDQIETLIQEQSRTRDRLFAPEPVLFFEPTSGSSGARKLIPYTASLRRSFTNLFLLWADDLLEHGPRIQRGSLFMSVSASRKTEQTGSGVPIGSSSDADFLSRRVAALTSHFISPPAAVAHLSDPDEHRRVTALFLLSADPEIVSVWNPTSLLVLLDYIDSHRPELLLELRRGWTMTSQGEFRFRKRHEVSPLSSVRVISCWGAAEARGGASELQRRFPSVLVQSKGLLATEAPITFPSIRAGGMLPMLNEVFLEFLAKDGRVLRLHQLERDVEYEVVITQRSGLLRYRLGDLLRVSGFHHATPLLEFVGRADAVSDLTGEKLSTAFVSHAVAKALSSPAMLLPRRATRSTPAGYILVGERVRSEDAQQLETLLCASPRYAEARLLGQLAPIHAMVVHGIDELTLRFLVARGVRDGDTKPRVLWHRVDEAADLLAMIEERHAPALQ